jgi:hypothetical protein
MTLLLLIKLLIAHLIGDFFTQSDKSVKSKEKDKAKSPALYIHIFIHGVLAMVALWDIELWYIAVIIMASHLLIDIAKLYATNKKNKRWLFVLDQVAHVAVIIAIYVVSNKALTRFDLELPASFWGLILCVLFLTTPISIALKMFFTRWKLDPKETGFNSLKNAGKWIGIIERLLVFVFIVAGQFGAVGFLLAAKSVFRFGDLNRKDNMKLTEYVLIGTLLSFGIAILTGLAFQQLVIL